MNEEFSLPKVRYDPEDVGRIRTVGFMLVLKVYGDHENVDGEEVLRARFEKDLKTKTMGDGRTRLKVAELVEMYSIPGIDEDGLKEIAQRRIRERKENDII